MSVNDPFVIQAFAEYLGAKNEIGFLADGNGEFTEKMGLGYSLEEH